MTTVQTTVLTNPPALVEGVHIAQIDQCVVKLHVLLVRTLLILLNAFCMLSTCLIVTISATSALGVLKRPHASAPMTLVFLVLHYQSASARFYYIVVIFASPPCVMCNSTSECYSTTEICSFCPEYQSNSEVCSSEICSLCSSGNCIDSQDSCEDCSLFSENECLRLIAIFISVNNFGKCTM